MYGDIFVGHYQGKGTIRMWRVEVRDVTKRHPFHKEVHNKELPGIQCHQWYYWEPWLTQNQGQLSNWVENNGGSLGDVCPHRLSKVPPNKKAVSQSCVLFPVLERNHPLALFFTFLPSLTPTSKFLCEWMDGWMNDWTKDASASSLALFI